MFFLFPVGVSHKASQRPWVTLFIASLCCLVSVVLILSFLSPRREEVLTRFLGLALIPAHPSWTAWITHLFLHAGLFHLLGNLAYLYIFGACMEDVLGKAWFALFFLGGGIVAAFGEIISSSAGWESTRPLVGASGAISACMGATAILLRTMTVEFCFAYYLLFIGGTRTFYLPAWLMMTIWFAIDLVQWVASMAGQEGNVAFGAHVCGFVFGALIAGLMKIAGWSEESGQDAAHSRMSEGPVRAAARPTTVVDSSAPETTSRLLFVWDNGTQLGPFPEAQIQEMVQLGSLGPEALYWDDTTAEWRPLSGT